MTQKLDLSKPVQTRDGRPARIICTDMKEWGKLPIVALVTEQDGTETYMRYDKDGTRPWINCDDPDDLVNVAEKWIGWLNLYQQEDVEELFAGRFEIKKETADAKASTCLSLNRVACLRVEYNPQTGNVTASVEDQAEKTERQ